MIYDLCCRCNSPWPPNVRRMDRSSASARTSPMWCSTWTESARYLPSWSGWSFFVPCSVCVLWCFPFQRGLFTDKTSSLKPLVFLLFFGCSVCSVSIIVSLSVFYGFFASSSHLLKPPSLKLAKQNNWNTAFPRKKIWTFYFSAVFRFSVLGLKYRTFLVPVTVGGLFYEIVPLRLLYLFRVTVLCLLDHNSNSTLAFQRARPGRLPSSLHLPHAGGEAVHRERHPYVHLQLCVTWIAGAGPGVSFVIIEIIDWSGLSIDCDIDWLALVNLYSISMSEDRV